MTGKCLKRDEEPEEGRAQKRHERDHYHQFAAHEQLLSLAYLTRHSIPAATTVKCAPSQAAPVL
jgi:hypothetical protein